FKRCEFTAQIKPDMIAEPVAVIRLDGWYGTDRSIRFLGKFGIVGRGIVDRHYFVIINFPFAIILLFNTSEAKYVPLARLLWKKYLTIPEFESICGEVSPISFDFFPLES